MKRVAVFASGNGSNFEAIVKSTYQNIKITLLVCDKPNAPVVEKAKKYDLDIFVFDPKTYQSKSHYETEIVNLLFKHQIDLVCLAGYMNILGPTLLNTYEGRIINIHPSLLPLFKGRNSIKEAYEQQVKETGVTIHYVNQEIDGGKIIVQEKIQIDGMNLEQLEAAIHQIEHRLYPKIIKEILEDNK